MADHDEGQYEVWLCGTCQGAMVKLASDLRVMSSCLPCWKLQQGYELTKSDIAYRDLQRYLKQENVDLVPSEAQQEITQEKMREQDMEAAKHRVHQAILERELATERSKNSAQRELVRKLKLDLAEARTDRVGEAQSRAEIARLKQVNRDQSVVVSRMLARVTSLEKQLAQAQSELKRRDTAPKASVFGASYSGRNNVITPEMAKDLLKLVHPDRHKNSELATEVTKWILTLR